MQKRMVILSLVLFFVIGISMTNKKNLMYHQKLSDYQLFSGNIKDQFPKAGVIPYALNAALFSDYAQKLRFVKLPEGRQVNYNPDSVLQFPVGTVIAKTFYYDLDERNSAKGRRLIETRILLHEEKGWVSLPYIWNEEQSEAYLEVAGGSTEVKYIDVRGEKRSIDYSIPNKNQCKTCHEKNGTMTPIGPSARQLNGDFRYRDGSENQLKRWAEVNMLSGLPLEHASIPMMVNYEDDAKPLEDRAKSYLDINCAHCHNKAGQAQTSGLFLDWKTADKTAYGFFKTPIAAGRGSGNLKFDIVPGKPQQSILVYRMSSADPGVAMPELGKSTIHNEGLKLITEWIVSMK